MKENKASYQTDGIAFEVAVEYNLYERKFDAIYHRKIRKVIKNDAANRYFLSNKFFGHSVSKK